MAEITISEVTPKMLKAADEANDLISVLDTIEINHLTQFVQYWSNEHVICSDGEKCQHTPKFQYLCYLVDEWQKRFK